MPDEYGRTFSMEEHRKWFDIQSTLHEMYRDGFRRATSIRIGFCQDHSSNGNRIGYRDHPRMHTTSGLLGQREPAGPRLLRAKPRTKKFLTPAQQELPQLSFF